MALRVLKVASTISFTRTFGSSKITSDHMHLASKYNLNAQCHYVSTGHENPNQIIWCAKPICDCQIMLRLPSRTQQILNNPRTCKSQNELHPMNRVRYVEAML